MTTNPGKLILIPTPIGNLGDMTIRAVETLRKVDLVLAEDTRQTRKLLSHFEISMDVESLHQNNEHSRVPGLINQLVQGKQYAYCSDAGTPAISDPGFLLVRAAIEANVEVECLPGATAFVPALVASGLPCDRFVFEGFLPHKKGRQKRWEFLKLESRTMVLYESPHRIFKLLDEIVEKLGPDRRIAIGRELSKMHETYYRGTAVEVIQTLQDDVAKGEFVVVISGNNNG
jgi:16S rRNA (cytidine1402-2'-O)-methyltransferase